MKQTQLVSRWFCRCCLASCTLDYLCIFPRSSSFGRALTSPAAPPRLVSFPHGTRALSECISALDGRCDDENPKCCENACWLGTTREDLERESLGFPSAGETCIINCLLFASWIFTRGCDGRMHVLVVCCAPQRWPESLYFDFTLINIYYFLKHHSENSINKSTQLIVPNVPINSKSNV
jgi:hypothetical protein